MRQATRKTFKPITRARKTLPIGTIMFKEKVVASMVHSRFDAPVKASRSKVISMCHQIKNRDLLRRMS